MLEFDISMYDKFGVDFFEKSQLFNCGSEIKKGIFSLPSVRLIKILLKVTIAFS